MLLNMTGRNLPESRYCFDAFPPYSLMSSENENCLYVGFDVGGTSIKAGVISDQKQVLDQLTVPTSAESAPPVTLQALQAATQKWFDQWADRIQGIGLGTPGPLNSKSGMILDPVNMPGWRNFPIKAEVEQRFGKPVCYANDANAAAFGEFWCGKSNRRPSSLLMLTLGTGVGAGIIYEGQLIVGAVDHAAECGHIDVEFASDARICPCGKPGHLEAYASATAVADRAAEWAITHPDSLMKKLLDQQGSLTAFDVYDCAQQQDPTALALVDSTADYLARAIANLAHTVDPELVVLGGAMNFGGAESQTGRRFLKSIDQNVRSRVFSRIADQIDIEFATLGSAAGWIGAAGLAKRVYDQAI